MELQTQIPLTTIWLAGQPVQSEIVGPVQLAQEEWQTIIWRISYLIPQANFLVFAMIFRLVIAESV